MLPGGRASRAAWLASRCSTSLTGVATPCSRPSSTISPLRKSASIDPVPRARLCQDEPPLRAEPFTGREAYLAARAAPPSALLCTLTVDSHHSADGTPRYMLGGEPVLTLDGARLVDAEGRPSCVTSAGSAPSLGKHLLMAYLPAGLAAPQTPLLVEYLGEQYPVTVASAGAVFDPSGSRMR